MCDAIAACLLAAAVWGGHLPAALPDGKPVPRIQAVPLPYRRISFTRDGQEIAQYHFSAGLRRPFLFPISGPSGRPLTRMGHPHDPEGHSHHNSVWISHNDVNGAGFWDDRGPGRIAHDRVLASDDGPASAWVLTRNFWLAGERRLLDELRRIEVRALPHDEWLLLIDLELRAEGDEVVLGRTPFGLLGVRMARTIGVNDGGGRIRNSEGGVNESQVLWKRARWVDYSGPVAPEIAEGITVFDHPRNPNHPTFFHVRNDGWMGASLSYDGPRRIGRDVPLRLRYGLWVHRGVPSPAEIESRWKEFASGALPELGPRPRN